MEQQWFYALTVKQPWAHLICHGYKSIENRSWNTNYRGPLLIHASKLVDYAGLGRATSLAKSIGVVLPSFTSWSSGGVVGVANLVDVITESDDMFFEGPFGFVLDEAKPITFYRKSGSPGLWKCPIDKLLDSLLACPLKPEACR